MHKQHLARLIQFVPFVSYNFLNKNETTLFIPTAFLISSLVILKNFIGTQYQVLSCISGIDYLHLKNRFTVAYDLLSLTFNVRIRIKVSLNEITPVLSITQIFKNADWFEREIWDLFGIYFSNHPDLRRILTDYGFEGFPMRKDFPLSGFFETLYNTNKKSVVIENIELSQEFRVYSHN